MPFPLVQIHFGQIRFHLKPEQMSGKNIKLSDEVNRAFRPDLSA
jgi:hypothetical protein